MINETQLTKYYQELSDSLNNMIPIEWDKIVFFTENTGNYSCTNFLYYENDIIRKGVEIPRDFNFSELEKRKFRIEDEEEVDEIIENMREEFINFGEEPFTTFAFFIDNQLSFEAKFGYEQPDYDMDDSRSDYGLGWALDSFGIKPIGDVDKKKLQDYHEFIAKYKDKKIF